MADVQVAAPSAAPEVPVSEISIPQRNTPAYAEWRNTGKLPTSEPTKEEAATSDTKEKTSDSEHAAGPETAQSQEPNRRRKPGAEERIGQLTAEIKQLREELAKKSDAKPADSSPAKPEPKAEARPAELKEPVEPEEPLEDNFDNWDKFQAAKKEYREKYKQYVRDVREYDRKMALREFQQQQIQREEQQKLQAQLDNARKVYGEDADKVIFPTTSRIVDDPKVPVLFKAVINDSDVAVDLLYVLGSKTQDFDALMGKMTSNDPKQLRAAMKEIFLVEKLIEEERSGKAKDETTKAAPERDGSGKFVKQAPEEKVPEKKVSSATPPTEELRGGGVPQDELERLAQAAEGGDPRATRAYMDAANRRDANRRKGI